jgi:hypothetical protein
MRLTKIRLVYHLFLSFTEDVKEEGVNVEVKGLVVEEELGQETEVSLG